MKTKKTAKIKPLQKTKTGIEGFDDITEGGLPKGRPTLICGGAGCGKTLFSMEFIIRGATLYNEPGVFVSFEESESELLTNIESLGFDIEGLLKQKKILFEHIVVERNQIEETGMYDLEGLFIRLNYAIDSIGAKRVVLDTIESLFSSFENQAVLRAELRRLFTWLKNKGVTVLITGEKGEGTLTRSGLEEYVSDCVIFFDHRVYNQIPIRRMRIVKYRGTSHGTNEYPFLIDKKGFSVLPITSLLLDYDAGDKKISSGIPRLDTMLGGEGFYKGSTILISGTAGTGKTSISSKFVEAACKRGERVLYFAFEESPSQIMRNMKSIGINLESWVKKDLLMIYATRPTHYGMENHLTMSINLINEFKPDIVVVDPINTFVVGEHENEINLMLLRLIDFLKMKEITAFFTSLSKAGNNLEDSEVAVSSLIDTWLLIRDIETGGERNRGLYIIKSRGMAHSNQIREFLITSKGIELLDVYTGTDGSLTGSERLSREILRSKENLLTEELAAKKIIELERKRKIMNAQIEMIRAEYEIEEANAKEDFEFEKIKTVLLKHDEKNMAKSRKADSYKKPVAKKI